MTQIDAGEPSETEEWADRADCFRIAHTLVDDLAWGEYEPDVMDVLAVARFLSDDY